MPHPIDQLVFVEDMARYGIHLHLGAQVDKISLEPLADNSFGPEYDSDLDTELARGDDAGTVYITKQAFWPKVREAVEVRGHQIIVYGKPYEERVIFGVMPSG